MAAFVYWICISSIQGQVSSWVIFKTFNFKVLQQLTNIFFVTYKTKVVCTKVLWLSRFYSNYQFVSFGGCFWIFGGSNNLDSIFWFHYVSCFCQQKKIRGAALGTAAGAFFAFIFQTQHSYLRYSKREVKYVSYSF